MSADGSIAGCYVHGLFASDAFRAAWLAELGAEGGSPVRYDAMIEETLDELALHLAAHVDMNRLMALTK